MKNLTVFSHKLFRRTPDGLQTDGALTLQLDALAAHFGQVIVCVPIVDDPKFQGVKVIAPNIQFSALPAFPNNLTYLRLLPNLYNRIKKEAQQADHALAIIPSRVGNIATIICQRHQIPVFQWVVGDWGSNVRSRHPPLFHIRILAALLDMFMKRLTANPLTFFNGKILYGHQQPHHQTRTSSSIQKNHLFIRKLKPKLTIPHRLLFIGRLSEEKGVKFLLKALAILTKQELNLHLDLVGVGEEEAALKQKVRQYQLEQQIVFHGYVPHGEQLRQLYRQSDLFVFPALQDQQPKVLMEAMSQSVPVLSTTVGGIPSVIKHGKNGWLVPAKDAGKLAAAIQQLLDDVNLRQTLVDAGIQYVKTRSVEAETARMMAIVHKHFDQIPVHT